MGWYAVVFVITIPPLHLLIHVIYLSAESGVAAAGTFILVIAAWSAGGDILRKASPTFTSWGLYP